MIWSGIIELVVNCKNISYVYTIDEKKFRLIASDLNGMRYNDKKMSSALSSEYLYVVTGRINQIREKSKILIEEVVQRYVLYVLCLCSEFQGY